MRIIDPKTAAIAKGLMRIGDYNRADDGWIFELGRLLFQEKPKLRDLPGILAALYGVYLLCKR